MSASDTPQVLGLDKYSAPQWLAARANRRFHVMAKPAGSACNLDCAYCFYLSKRVLPGGPGSGHMPDEVLERFVKDYIDSVTSDEVVFSWQGGEPTLLGLEFFEKVVALQKKHARAGQRIENDLQTNGTLLDDDWARFLKQQRFLVGLSIDGPREIHDHCRITKHAEPTFDQVFAAAKMLQKHGVRFNTLTCVHRYNASRPLDVYRFLRREIGSTYIQFIPIVEIRGFENMAPGTWDEAKLPMLGATHGAAVTGLRAQRNLRQGRRAGTRRRRVQLRPLRLPGVPAWQHSPAVPRRHGVLAAPGEVRLREIGDVTCLLQTVRVPQRLLGRMPEEPFRAHTRRRAGPQLPLSGVQALLCPRGPTGTEDGDRVARGDAGATLVTRGLMQH